jgi:hypothetical protein
LCGCETLRLKAFEIRVLKRISGCRRGINKRRSFVICKRYQLLLGEKVKEDENGGASRTLE